MTKPLQDIIMRTDEEKWIFNEKDLKQYLDGIVERYVKSFDSSSTKFIEEREVHKTLKRLSSKERNR